MHNTYTSGAARRNAITAQAPANDDYLTQTPGEYVAWQADLDAVRDRVNAEHDAAGRINPILDYFRDDTYQGDPDLHYHAAEYLFQLGRHWAEWQSARIGTFPHDMRDTFGPCTREESEESGEDRAYWYIADALNAHDDDGDRVQDYIAHATAVIGRLYSMSAEDGE